MRTKKLTTYRQFVKAGRNYLPIVDQCNGLMLLPNFAINGESGAIKHKRRLVITSGAVYNRENLIAVWVACTSCQGFRERWLYWYYNRVTGLWFRLRWYDLTSQMKTAIARAYVKQASKIPMNNPPCKNIQKWLFQ
jgi:hypothetical protein